MPHLSVADADAFFGGRRSVRGPRLWRPHLWEVSRVILASVRLPRSGPPEPEAVNASAPGAALEPDGRPSDRVIAEGLAADPDADLLRAVFNEYPHGTVAFGRLVHRHWATIHASCQAILLQEQDAEEATQDAFLKAHRYLPSFRFESRFLTWLRRIAKNSALNRYRDRRTDRAARERAAHDPTLRSWWTPWRKRPPSDDRRALMHALESLSPEDRMLIILHDVEGIPHREIAETLGLGHGAVRMRAVRARAALRARLSDPTSAPADR